MKIYISHSTRFNYTEELYDPIMKHKIYAETDISLPHLYSGNPFLADARNIKQFQLIFAEVSYPSTGQGIELGWANSHNIEIICIYKKSSKYSSALKSVATKFIEYLELDEIPGIISSEVATLL